MNGKSSNNAKFGVKMSTKKGLVGNTGVKGNWKVIARDSEGNIKWMDEWENSVVDTGLQEMLTMTLKSGTPKSTWYVGLTDGTPTVADSDTLASHAGWVEVTAYDEANRVEWVDAALTGSAGTISVTSTAGLVFTVSANSTTIGGAFLASSNTKSGTSGVLYAAGAFTAGDKVLDDNDTLTVTATFTVSNS